MSLAYNSAVQRQRILGLPDDWFHVAVGLLLAPVFTLTPLLQLVGWYFRALVHEMGHTAAAWLTGVPAVPALGITAEAATMHGEQQLPLVLVVWAALVWLAYNKFEPPARYVTLGLLATLFPVLCFTDMREAWHMASGHLGELLVGGLFLARALSGGFGHGHVERSLYGTMGWSLIGQNVFLTAGLMTSASARADYAANGSFGIENDYVRLAQWNNGTVEGCAFIMTLLAVAVAPCVFGLWILRGRDES